MNKKESRTLRLLEMLKVNQRMDVRSVAKALSVSDATARRFFGELERQGKVIRIHGGVQLAPELDFRYSYRQSALHRVGEKTAIGKAALEYIASDDRIFLDSGSTVIRLAEAIALRLQSNLLQNIVVVTNSLDLSDVIARFAKVILVGGEIRLERRDVHGTLAEKALARFRVSKAFLGADGIDIENGFMTTDEQTAGMAEIVIERARHTYILADSEKFGRPSFINYAPLNGVDLVITDDQLTESTMAAFLNAGARIRAVSPGESEQSDSAFSR